MRILILAFTLVLAACGERITPAPVQGETHEISFQWHIVDRATLESEYRRAGMPLADNERLQGFVGTYEDRHVVYTLAPARVDDAAVCTLGHEIMHITHGDYHR